MPKLTQEGAFTADVRRAINDIAGQFGKLGKDPAAAETPAPITEGSNFFYPPVTSGLTALAGGGQSGATPLTGQLNTVSTVASGNDSVLLPASRAGLWLIVANLAASNSMNVYAATGDTINAIAANSPFAVAANKRALFYCVVAGAWYSILTA